MSKPDLRTSNGLRHVRRELIDDLEAGRNDEVSLALEWAANELDRLTAIIKVSDGKTYAISNTTAEDMRVRTRMYGILAWHVNRAHADLSDHELAQAAFREYCKHWGRVLLDPNE